MSKKDKVRFPKKVNSQRSMVNDSVSGQRVKSGHTVIRSIRFKGLVWVFSLRLKVNGLSYNGLVLGH